MRSRRMPQAATEFYGRVLDDAVVMLLPGGMRLDDRATIIASMAGAPWASYRLEDINVLRVTDDGRPSSPTARSPSGPASQPLLGPR